MHPGLSLDQAPPLPVPLKFFLTVPVFGALAGLLLLLDGPALAIDRWTPRALAWTHLVSIGVLSMAMSGALFQMLPVVAGARVVNPRLLSTGVHLALSLGTLAIALGFAASWPTALMAAVVLLTAGFGTLVWIVFSTLLRAPRRHPAVTGMRLAIVAVAMAAGAGLTLLLGHTDGPVPLFRESLSHLHQAWATLGWVAILLLSVAFQVVPMFQLTPEYPVSVTRWTGPGLFAALAGWTALDLYGQWHWLRAGLETVVSFGLVGAALVTLRLQFRRRRKLEDVSLWFWRVAMLSLTALVTLYWTWRLALPIEESALLRLMGVLVLIGFPLAAINGMLYKIVPFLCWLHLQTRALESSSSARVPGMRSLSPPTATRYQFHLFVLAQAALLIAAVEPDPAARIAGLLMIASHLLLAINLLLTLRRYRDAGLALQDVTD